MGCIVALGCLCSIYSLALGLQYGVHDGRPMELLSCTVQGHGVVTAPCGITQDHAVYNCYWMSWDVTAPLPENTTLYAKLVSGTTKESSESALRDAARMHPDNSTAQCILVLDDNTRSSNGTRVVAPYALFWYDDPQAPTPEARKRDGMAALVGGALAIFFFLWVTIIYSIQVARSRWVGYAASTTVPSSY